MVDIRFAIFWLIYEKLAMGRFWAFVTMVLGWHPIRIVCKAIWKVCQARDEELSASHGLWKEHSQPNKFCMLFKNLLLFYHFNLGIPVVFRTRIHPQYTGLSHLPGVASGTHLYSCTGSLILEMYSSCVAERSCVVVQVHNQEKLKSYYYVRYISFKTNYFKANASSNNYTNLN